MERRTLVGVAGQQLPWDYDSRGWFRSLGTRVTSSKGSQVVYRSARKMQRFLLHRGAAQAHSRLSFENQGGVQESCRQTSRRCSLGKSDSEFSGREEARAASLECAYILIESRFESKHGCLIRSCERRGVRERVSRGE